MSEANGGRCYLCGRFSKGLRYECICRGYERLLVYLCEECEIVVEEVRDDPTRTDPE